MACRDPFCLLIGAGMPAVPEPHSHDSPLPPQCPWARPPSQSPARSSPLVRPPGQAACPTCPQQPPSASSTTASTRSLNRAPANGLSPLPYGKESTSISSGSIGPAPDRLQPLQQNCGFLQLGPTSSTRLKSLKARDREELAPYGREASCRTAGTCSAAAVGRPRPAWAASSWLRCRAGTRQGGLAAPPCAPAPHPFRGRNGPPSSAPLMVRNLRQITNS